MPSSITSFSMPAAARNSGDTSTRPVESSSTSMALPRKILFHHCAAMGSWATRSRNVSHSGRGKIMRQPCGWRVMVRRLSAVAASTSRCRVGMDSRPLASRLSDDAPWNTFVDPHCSGTAKGGVVSHDPPLHCTFLHCSRKTLRRNPSGCRFGNEIKHLQTNTEAPGLRFPFEIQHLAGALDVSQERSKNVARKVLVAAQLAQARVHVSRIHCHGLPFEARRLEAHLVEQPLHHGGQAPRTDVLGALVHVAGDLGEPRDAVGR